MPRAASARRYAQALFQIAQENDTLDIWAEELIYLSSILEQDALLQFLDSPQVPMNNKFKVIEEALGEATSQLGKNLVCILSSRSMTYSLPNISAEYKRILNNDKGIEEATVVSAIQLSAEHIAKVQSFLEIIVTKKVTINDRVDPSIIGGFIARVGDHLIDGSTLTRLRELRRELSY